MSRSEWRSCLIVALVIILNLVFWGGGVLAVFEAALATWQEPDTAVVAERVHGAALPEDSSRQVGVDEAGNVIVTPVQNAGGPWVVIFWFRGRVYATPVSPEEWANAKKGQEIQASWKRGGVFGRNYGWKLTF